MRSLNVQQWKWVMLLAAALGACAPNVLAQGRPPGGQGSGGAQSPLQTHLMLEQVQAQRWQAAANQTRAQLAAQRAEVQAMWEAARQREERNRPLRAAREKALAEKRAARKLQAQTASSP